MAGKYMKRWSSALVTMELLIKSKVNNMTDPLEGLNLKRLTMTSVNKDTEQWRLATPLAGR